jgi:excinuclease ABC subunit B
VIRFEFFGDEIDEIFEVDPLTGEIRAEKDSATIYPVTHYVTPQERMQRAIRAIGEELEERLDELHTQGNVLAAQRLEQRTRYDLELLREAGFCNGIENYSRHLDGRQPGEPPATLLNYFPEDFLLLVDESHVDAAAGGGDVQRRPFAQADPRRSRLPAAQRARQPAAALRGVREAHPPDGLRQRDALGATS